MVIFRFIDVTLQLPLAIPAAVIVLVKIAVAVNVLVLDEIVSNPVIFYVNVAALVRIRSDRG